MTILDSRPDHPKPPASSEERESTPSVASQLARYRHMVKAAPPDVLERAIAQALTELPPAPRQRICDRLAVACSAYEEAYEENPTLRSPSVDDGSPSLATPTRLARLAALAEKQQAGSVERALRSPLPAQGATREIDDALWYGFLSAFVRSQATRAFFSAVTPRDESLDGDSDFSEEFGYKEGFAGGSGFEKDEFDKWI
jgi:hypothetical protein